MDSMYSMPAVAFPQECGHSACSQHYIDTGRRDCVSMVTVQVQLEVNNAHALVDAAAAKALDEGLDRVATRFNVDRLGDCARYLMVPDEPPAGCAYYDWDGNVGALKAAEPMMDGGESQSAAATVAMAELAAVVKLIEEAKATQGAPGGKANLMAAEVSAGRFVASHHALLHKALQQV